MIDTSAMIAALVAQHEHHELARERLTATTRVPAIVLAKTYAQMRRTFAQSAAAAARLLAPWTDNVKRVLPTTASTVVAVFRDAVELDLGGNIHEALVAQTCIAHGVTLTTLDARQHSIARALGGKSVYLLTG